MPAPQLHTLRVLGPAHVDLHVVGKLVAGLPNLCHLAFSMDIYTKQPASVHEELAALKQATQLQELSLSVEMQDPGCCDAIAGLLPTSLRRLAWQNFWYLAPPDLSHLSNLSFLRLPDWQRDSISSSQVPPSLQELQLSSMDPSEEVFKEHSKVLNRFRDPCITWSGAAHITMGSLSCLLLGNPALCKALGSLPSLSSLTVTYTGEFVMPGVDAIHATVPAAASVSTLRTLHLDMYNTIPATGLAVLTGLTRLSFTLCDPSISEQQQREWAGELGSLVNLRWLSVPAQLLLAEQPWLGGLQQLRVLVLGLLREWSGDSLASCLTRVLECLQGRGPQAMPPRLQLLGLTDVGWWHAAAAGLHPLWRHVPVSTGCEVVVGGDLDLLWDATHQLAGLPEGLQQALLA